MPRTLLVALLSLVVLGGSSLALGADTGSAPDSAAQHKVIVYYLYFTPRCETCINMEKYAKEAVEKGFPQEIKQGLVEWHAYDTGQKEYEHYWDDFKLETKSLVVVEMRNGQAVRWKNCEKIWDLVNAYPDYLKYVQDEIRAYLSAE